MLYYFTFNSHWLQASIGCILPLDTVSVWTRGGWSDWKIKQWLFRIYFCILASVWLNGVVCFPPSKTIRSLTHSLNECLLYLRSDPNGSRSPWHIISKSQWCSGCCTMYLIYQSTYRPMYLCVLGLKGWESCQMGLLCQWTTRGGAQGKPSCSLPQRR